MGFLNKTLPLSVKSSPPPRPQAKSSLRAGELSKPSTSSAMVLVGSTFKNVVLDESKDVAVLFYAPWCPGSQLVEPVIDAAAGRVRLILRERRAFSLALDSSVYIDDEDAVVVAKMDLTENDIPVRGISVRAYPSLWLWPRGRKSEPLEYSKYNHEREDGQNSHSHYELGMVLDFLTHFENHTVRSVHHDGGYFDHLFDDEESTMKSI
jgi:thiol-disulfide isomerase/thioredoxin